MGYTTEFTGGFTIEPALTPEQVAYLQAFGGTRRMKRRAAKCKSMSDPMRLRVGLPVGPEGAYFAGGLGFAGQDIDPSVIDHNRPPEGQPSLWCEWIPSEDGTRLEWSGGEKFYYYCEWANYLCKHFLTRWHRTLTGRVRYQGEDYDDRGVLVARTDHVENHPDQIIEYPGN